MAGTHICTRVEGAPQEPLKYLVSGSSAPSGVTPINGLIEQEILQEKVEGNRLKNHGESRPGPIQGPTVDQPPHGSGHPLERLEYGSSSGTRPPSSRRFEKRPRWLWPGIALLMLLHHDFWFWDDARLVFGFIPTGMAYHIVYSILASLFWLIAIRRAWPDELENWTDSGESGSGGRRI